MVSKDGLSAYVVELTLKARKWAVPCGQKKCIISLTVMALKGHNDE